MYPALKTLTMAAFGSLAFAGAAPAATHAGHRHAGAMPIAPTRTDPALEWNRFVLDLQAAPGNQPATVHPTYELALTHAAIYDAVMGIDRLAPPYLVELRGPRSASPEAAADAAAHATLSRLYPNLQASIDSEYTTLVGQVRAGAAKDAGVRFGQRVAAAVLAGRAGDGSGAAPSPFQPGTQPGDYQLTPPAFAQPVFTHWPHVTPFLLRHADQFRPPAPPPLTSPKYAAAISEVQSLGAAQGSTRTPDQTQIGMFWNAPIWATWNRIAEGAAQVRGKDLPADAQAFAALNLTAADSVIAFYDAKYAYARWRPVTAIHSADADNNPDTTADPDWTPLSATAPDPSYPGAHATVSAGAGDVLSAIYGARLSFTLTSPATPGVTRSFVSFGEAAQEASISRIYNGNHTRIDEVAGEGLGHRVAAFVLKAPARRGR
jgi:hypothetical protein